MQHETVLRSVGDETRAGGINQTDVWRGDGDVRFTNRGFLLSPQCEAGRGHLQIVYTNQPRV